MAMNPIIVNQGDFVNFLEDFNCHLNHTCSCIILYMTCPSNYSVTLLRIGLGFFFFPVFPTLPSTTVENIYKQ